MRIGILLFDQVDLLDVGGPYEVFLTAGAIYFSITTTLSWALRRLESRLGTDKLQTVEKGALRAAEMVHA